MAKNLVVLPWLKAGATPVSRAIGIVEDARQRGLLQGTWLDAITLRGDIVQAIEAHAAPLARAEARLLEDGYRECGECSEWVHSDVWVAGRLSDGAVYCSRDCRSHAEPACVECSEPAREGERTCSDSCARADMQHTRADAYRLARVEMMGVA